MTKSTPLLAIAHFLRGALPASLLASHPNDAAASRFVVPAAWSSWWDDWASEARWVSLIRYYTGDAPGELADNTTSPIPSELCALIDAIKRLQLPRSALDLPAGAVHLSAYGMSPIKFHQVQSMLAIVVQMRACARGLIHVVDVGAGQGYLSRALAETLDLHVLALDSSQSQISGSKRWQERKTKKFKRRRKPHGSDSPCSSGSITYKTTHITSSTLPESIDEWILSFPPTTEQVPVLVVALHACGSLTPSIVRFFLQGGKGRGWKVAGMVVVGCCYNLLDEADFPLSRPLLSLPHSHSISLTPRHHLQLASQTPSQWLLTPEAFEDAKMAVKKVVWRGLLEGFESGNLQAAGKRRRLGKLNDRVYSDWDTFVAIASEKIGLQPNHDHEKESETRRTQLQSRLEILHVLRCLLGPLVESLIILDRFQWIHDELRLLAHDNDDGDRRGGMEVQIRNIFDQGLGGPRNVALIISPSPVANM